MAFLMACGSTAEPALIEGDDAQGGASSANASEAGGGGAAGVDDEPASACAEMMGEGYAVGDIAENWSLPNAVGEMIELHDLCGKVIFYEEGSMW